MWRSTVHPPQEDRVGGEAGRKPRSRWPADAGTTVSWLGLAGTLISYVIFTLVGIGDTDIFDWGGGVGAIIGTLIVLGLAGCFLRRRQPGPAAPTRAPGDDGPRPVS